MKKKREETTIFIRFIYIQCLLKSNDSLNYNLPICFICSKFLEMEELLDCLIVHKVFNT